MKSLLCLLTGLLPLLGTVAAQDVDPFALPSARLKSDTEPELAAVEVVNTNATQSALLSQVSSIKPGEPFTVALKLTHEEGWHSYYINTGLIGDILAVEWNLPDGFTVRSLGWPTPHLSESFGYQTIGYEGTVSHLYEVTPPAGLAIGSSVTLSLDASWQICNADGCRPEEATESVTLDVADTAVVDAFQSEDFERAHHHYPLNDPGLTVMAAEHDNVISLRISPASSLNSKSLHFFDEDAQVSVQEPQKATLKGEVITLELARNQGNDFQPTPGPVLDTLRGILTDGTTSYFVETARKGEATAEQSASHAMVVTKDSAEDIAAMAELYEPSQKISYVSLRETAETTLWTALVGAFIGGILLNLMPCVFPVLGLKVMGFVEQAGNDPKKIKLHGVAFAAGLVVSMWVLAGIILFLKISLGKDVNWGQQMGNPYFVGAIILLLFVLGLNMAGVFEIGTSLTSAGQKVKKKGYSGSFFSGVLTTLIATPCSGPFLGAAMSYTLAQPAVMALFLFTIFALGIALPYLLLSFFPALINKLPKPGAWMETFKITMSFALFATVAFFMKTFGAQTGVDGLSLMIMALVIIGLALYFFGHWSMPYRKPNVRLFAGKLLPLVIGAGGLYLLFQATNTAAPAAETTHGWVAWQPGKVEHSRAKKRIVWVDYTADW